MLCPRCGKPVPPGAAFCPACGSPTTPTALRPPAPTTATQPRPASAAPAAPRAPVAPSAATVAADFEAQRNRTRWTMAGVGLATLIAAFFGARAFGLLRLGANSPKPGLQVRADVAPAALQLPARVNPAPLQQVAERKQMPADVEAWLKHLEKCEQQKIAIEGDQVAEMTLFKEKASTMGAGMGYQDPFGKGNGDSEDVSPDQYTKNKFEDLRPKWNELISFFNSVPPPEECKPLASDFNSALYEIPGMVGDINDVLNSVMSDPDGALQKAMKMRDKSRDLVDRPFARADQKLTEICKKYDHTKWFNIKTDIQMSPTSLFGATGGLGNEGLGQ